MAYIYGSPGREDAAAAFAGRRAVLLRIALPLLFLFSLASAGLHAFLQGSHILTAISAVFFVFLLLRFEELGLTLAQRFSGSEGRTRAVRMAAKTLRLLPDGYHVFHDLELGGLRIDHVVVGPNGFFPIINRTNLGRITDVRDSLRLNGLPFLRDVVSLSWRRSQALLRRLDLGHSGDLQVCPVLCFSRASVDAGRLMRGVMIAQTSTLVRLILEHEASLGSEKLLKLTDKLTPMVRARTAEPEITHQESLPGAAEVRAAPEARRPACNKCHHVPSDLEAELFPGECPRCGRLHSAAAHEVVPTLTGTPRTPAAALVTGCLIVAAGSALLSYQAGLFDPDTPTVAAPPPAQEERDGATKAAAATAPTAQRPPTAGAPAVMPATEPAPEPAQTARGPEPGNGAPRPGAESASGGTSAEATDSACPPLPADDAAAKNASLDVEAQATGAPVPTDKPASATVSAVDPSPVPQPARRDAAIGTLTIVTARPVTLWLTNDHTFKRFGPFEAKPRKALDIVLPKGCYSVVLVDNGKRRQTSVSFLGDTGRLEF